MVIRHGLVAQDAANGAFGAAGERRQSGRGWATSELTLSALVIVGFVVLLNVAR